MTRSQLDNTNLRLDPVIRSGENNSVHGPDAFSRTESQNTTGAWAEMDALNRAGTQSAMGQFGNLVIADSRQTTGLHPADQRAENAQETSFTNFSTEPESRNVHPVDAAAIRNYLQNGRQQVDYGAMLSRERPVLFVGENHRDPEGRAHIADQAAAFRRAGVTHFAMESIPRSMQGTLDRFFEGNRDARNELSRYLDNSWGRDYPGSAAGYMRILDAMRAEGIRPVGLDVHNHLDDTAGHRRQRDQAWAETISNIIRTNRDARVVAFGGSAHFGNLHATPSNTSELLRADYRIESTSALLVGGANQYNTDPGRQVSDQNLVERSTVTTAIPRMARRLGVGDQTFQVPTDGREHMYDYQIHLPQRRLENP